MKKLVLISFFLFISSNVYSYMEVIAGRPVQIVNGHAYYDVQNPNSASHNLWEVLREHFVLPDFSYNREVQEQIRWYAYHRSYFERVLNRARPYLYYIYQHTRQRHLPAELALLPTIESAYNPFAYSHAGAAGLWQIMPVTADYFGIKHSYWYDGRRDIMSSTKMALGYLTYLNEFFNHDWLLAVAAYDSGEGTVLNAIQYNLHVGRSANFWYLPLPQETQAYVPRFFAVIEIIRHPARYGFHLPYVSDKPYLGEVTIDYPMRLAKIAELAKLQLEQVYEFNPGYNRWITGPKGPFHLLLPVNKIKTFQHRLAYYNQHRTIIHTVKKGESLSVIAHKFRRSLNEIKLANNLKNNSIRIGEKLKIPPSNPIIQKPNTHNSNHGFFHKEHAPFKYTVNKGDSLWTLAKNNDVSIGQIKMWNQIKSNADLKVGKELFIWPGNSIHIKHRVKIMHHTIRRGDNLSTLAKKYHASIDDIRKWNHLGKNHILQIGEHVVFYITSS